MVIEPEFTDLHAGFLQKDFLHLFYIKMWHRNKTFGSKDFVSQFLFRLFSKFSYLSGSFNQMPRNGFIRFKLFRMIDCDQLNDMLWLKHPEKNFFKRTFDHNVVGVFHFNLCGSDRPSALALFTGLSCQTRNQSTREEA